MSSFYRYVLEPEVLFQADGSFSPGPMAKFLDMPQSPLFTLNLNTPESWMVESVRTRYDLDNIYLEEVRFAREERWERDVQCERWDTDAVIAACVLTPPDTGGQHRSGPVRAGAPFAGGPLF